MEHGIRGGDGPDARQDDHLRPQPPPRRPARDLFDEMYPQYGGTFCRVIDNYEPRAEQLIDDFKDPNNELTIAHLGRHARHRHRRPEVVNLVFAKPVKSYVKFWQMIGRGTRLCHDLFGPGQDKTRVPDLRPLGQLRVLRTSYTARPTTRSAKSCMQLVFESPHRARRGRAPTRPSSIPSERRSS